MTTETFTWEDFDNAIDIMASRIRQNKKFRDMKTITGIPRGGLVVAVALSHKLDSIPVVDYVNRGTLLVDDISDSGKTLLQYTGAILTATIHIVPGTSFIPDIWIKERTADWVIYPWEVK